MTRLYYRLTGASILTVARVGTASLGNGAGHGSGLIYPTARCNSRPHLYSNLKRVGHYVKSFDIELLELTSDLKSVNKII